MAEEDIKDFGLPDDVDYEAMENDPAAELAFLDRLAEMGDEPETETPKAEAVEPKTDEQEGEAKAEAEAEAEAADPLTAADPQDKPGEIKPEGAEPEVKAEEPAKAAEESPEMAQLRQEREALEARLQELSQANAQRDARLQQLEGYLAGQRDASMQQTKAKEPEPEVQATAEDILNEFDNRIADVEGTLDAAEDDPTMEVDRKELRANLRRLERARTEFMLQQAQSNRPSEQEIATQASARVFTDQQLAEVRNEVIREFPALNPRGQEFDQSLHAKVMEIYKPLYNNGAGGMTPGQALAKATLLVTRSEGVEPMSVAQQRLAAEQAKQAEEAAKAEATLAETKAKEAEAAAAAKAAKPTRKEDAVERNIDAANRVPPNLSGTGQPGVKVGDRHINLDDMSIEQFISMTDTPEKEAALERAFLAFDEETL